LDLGEEVAELTQGLAADLAVGAGMAVDQDAFVQAHAGDLGLEDALVEDVLDLLAATNLVEGRAGDEDAAVGDELGQLAEEEGQQQGADVRAVDVGVGHDDDLAVAQAIEAEILADAAAEGLDHGRNLAVADDLVDARLLDVDDLALEREDGLE